LGDAWFAEPSVQVDYTHLLTKDYNLTGTASTEVNTADSDVFRFVQAVRVGRVWDLGDGAFIQPAARFGLEEQVSNGGRMRINSDPAFRPNTDGLRGIVGIGISWQFTPVQQIHFDYETSFGDKVDRPWALNAGYRLRF
jgi:outer membrane autotransporter protein